VIASDALVDVLGGIERADSVTIDAHKWFATTMGCGMFFIKDAKLLSAAFQSSASYMPSNLANLDPYVTMVQWSRRFLGLRLFLSLAVAGWDGYGRHVERCVKLAGMIAEQLEARGWSIANASRLAVLCTVPPGESRRGPGDRQARARVRPRVCVACNLRGTAGDPDPRDPRRDGARRRRQARRRSRFAAALKASMMGARENLTWLRDTGRRYIIGAPKSELKRFAGALATAA
jgi:glutamate/tyrosine decarboxylase-like PLP-dependent enzyme